MIKHDGNNMPCSPETNVIVKLRGGDIKVGCAQKFIWNWNKAPYIGDVIHYQVMPWNKKLFLHLKHLKDVSIIPIILSYIIY